VLERALEGDLRLVSGELGDGAGRPFRCLKRFGSDRHANADEQVAGRTAEALFKVANKCGPRLVAALSKLGKGPSPGGLAKEGGERGDEPGICCER
jgi:hypothetical protein